MYGPRPGLCKTAVSPHQLEPQSARILTGPEVHVEMDILLYSVVRRSVLASAPGAISVTSGELWRSPICSPRALLAPLPHLKETRWGLMMMWGRLSGCKFGNGVYDIYPCQFGVWRPCRTVANRKNFLRWCSLNENVDEAKWTSGGDENWNTLRYVSSSRLCARHVGNVEDSSESTRLSEV